MKPSLKTCVLCLILIAGGTLSIPAVDFIRGDANDDGRVTLADAHRILRFLFFGGQGFTCGDAADVNNDGILQLTDAVGIITYLYMERESPKAPFPKAGPD